MLFVFIPTDKIGVMNNVLNLYLAIKKRKGVREAAKKA